MANSKINYRPVIIWLFTGVFLIILMVGVGGSVRLTNSGLSIVHWNPITGVIPPLNEAEWKAEFEQYKKIPEYQQEHKDFELSDFKVIFLWEYFHRLIARLVGLIFLIPFIYFLLKGYFKNRKLLWKIVSIFIFASFQAWLGWFMVRSGFADRYDVSHYRLAIHLFVATMLVSLVFWTAMELKYKDREIDISLKPKFKTWTIWVIVLFLLQEFYGAFTAGLNAGYYYSDYPLMGGEWFPSLASVAWQSEWILSIFKDPSMVYFIHRWFGLILFSVILLFYLKFKPKVKSKEIKFGLNLLIILIALQLTLGILTVLTNINIVLAVWHQVNAILIFLTLVSLLFFYMARYRSNVR